MKTKATLLFFALIIFYSRNSSAQATFNDYYFSCFPVLISSNSQINNPDFLAKQAIENKKSPEFCLITFPAIAKVYQTFQNDFLDEINQEYYYLIMLSGMQNQTKELKQKKENLLARIKQLHDTIIEIENHLPRIKEIIDWQEIKQSLETIKQRVKKLKILQHSI